MINDEADEVIEELLKSLQNRYQNNLETPIRWNVVSVSSIMFIDLHVKINLNLGGSYIDSPNQIKSKKATINPVNKKGNKFFQYAGTVSLNHEEIKKDP